MGPVYKLYIYTIFSILVIYRIIRSINNYIETFAPLISDKEIEQKMKIRNNPPFSILEEKKPLPLQDNDSNIQDINIEGSYILIPKRDREKWRRLRDTPHNRPSKKCEQTLCPVQSKKSPYSSYTECYQYDNEYGFIQPKIYSHTPRSQLEIPNTYFEMVPNIKTPNKLPFTKETKHKWICQRKWECFSPKEILEKPYRG